MAPLYIPETDLRPFCSQTTDNFGKRTLLQAAPSAITGLTMQWIPQTLATPEQCMGTSKSMAVEFSGVSLIALPEEQAKSRKVN